MIFKHCQGEIEAALPVDSCTQMIDTRHFMLLFFKTWPDKTISPWAPLDEEQERFHRKEKENTVVINPDNRFVFYFIFVEGRGLFHTL